jgi:hypothetical protein
MVSNVGTDNVKRDINYPACGRLIALESQGNRHGAQGLGINDLQNYFGLVINFPAMPDAIELVRRADYMVTNPIGFPDGIHMYKGTSVLEIPISFKLHAFDEKYCPNGVKTLLQIAANLQAFTLPFGDYTMATRWGIQPEKEKVTTQPATQAGSKNAGEQASVLHNSADTFVTNYTPAQGIYPPVTCYLELILTELDSVGIACVGYVKEVKARLCGPFMRGQSLARNLPTHGEFEFIFVYHPGHGNNFIANQAQSGFTEQQTYAQVVQTRLYNTIHLLTNSGNFKGFND